MTTRANMWASVGEDVDILVVGGGINGAGIARDASRRGLSVLLVEQNDLAFGTSSRSSKLVHGGLRYLEHFEFSLVFEAVSERKILLETAPHLVTPLGFLFPIYSDSRQSLPMLRAGMWLYDGLSLFRSPKLHQTLGPSQVAKEVPSLRTSGLRGAPLYYDCATDDARLTLECALDAVQHGATIATYARCVKIACSESVGDNVVTVEDVRTGEQRDVRAKLVVNATGPWTDKVRSMASPAETSLLRPTKGVHAVVPADRLAVPHAVVCFHPDDGRVLFAIPWGPHTYLGTTDTDFDGDPGAVRASADDVAYLLNAANAYFPDAQLQPADVVSTWAGLRPLMRPVGKDNDMDESAVSREHQIVVEAGGNVVTIAGGKLTTFRKMSAEVVDTAVRLLKRGGQLGEATPRASDTEEAVLPGAVQWPDSDAAMSDFLAQVVEAAADTLDKETAHHLVSTYGTRALEVARLCAESALLAERIDEACPDVLAQVVYAARCELASSVADVLVRRTQLFYRSPDQAVAVSDRVGAILAEELGYDSAERQEIIEAYRRRVGLSRAWADEPVDVGVAG